MNNEIKVKKYFADGYRYCTLKCKLCLSYTPYYKNPEVLSLGKAKEVLERYFSIIDYVDKFSVTGGEPLTNREIVSIMKLIYQFKDQIGEVIFITNGTRNWPEGLLELFAIYKENTRIIINNYGNNLSTKAEQLYQEAIKTMFFGEIYKKNVILYTEDNRYGWIDCRNHEQKHKTDEEIKNQAESCEFFKGKKYIINHGEIHLCTRSFYRMLEGIIPQNQKEYLDLAQKELSIDASRNHLFMMEQLSKYTSCGYCSGLTKDTVKHPAAEQLTVK